MKHVVSFVPAQIIESDTVEFHGNTEIVTISISAFLEMARCIGFQNRITLIKIVRGMCMGNNTDVNETEDTVLSLKLSKDIVEWFADRYDAQTRY